MTNSYIDSAIDSAPLNKATSHQRGVLRLLTTRTTWSIGEVAETLGISNPAATKLAIRLERRGMIKRMQDDDDRRFTRISLTPSGREQSLLF